MEVNRISQGGQNNLDFIDNNSQTNTNVNMQDKKPQKTDENDGSNGNTQDKIDAKKLNKAVDMLNGFLKENKTHAEYEVHNTYKHDIIVKIVDDVTGQVVMEVPPKKILDMVAKMCEIVGVLFDRKA